MNGRACGVSKPGLRPRACWNTRPKSVVSEAMEIPARPRLATDSAPKRWMLLGGVGMLVVAVVLFAYFGAEIRANERKAPKGPPAIPVTVAPVRQEVVPFRLLAIGNVEAYATVSVKARVDGQIVEVGFKEGESVPRNRVLFNIDPRPYEAVLRQAEANFLRDTAQKDQARSQEQRYKD